MTLALAEEEKPAPAGPLRLPRPTLLLAVSFTVLVVLSLTSMALVSRAREDSTLVAHTLRVMNAISQMQLTIRRAESAERGYLLTGADGFLGFYRESRAQLAPTLSEITTLTADNPAQQQRATEIGRLLDVRIADLDRAVALRSAGDVAAAVADIKADRAEGAMGRLGLLLVEMKAEEQSLLDERTRASKESVAWLSAVSVIAITLIMAVGALALVLNRRAIAALHKAQADLATANAGLEQRVAERTAELKEANDEIQSFAYIVSHDLRSPLVNIMGFTSEIETMRGELFERLATLRARAGEDGAADARLEAEFEEALGFIKTSISRMDRLIHAILTLSREGRKEFAPAPVDVRALVETIVASMAHQLQERGATVTCRRLPVIETDRLALEQIFTNLLDNAVKYLRDDAPGHIEVSAVETPGFVTFAVRDNGRGIDPKDKGRVFELFRRSGRQDRPGEGIGLAHVRALVRRMGGLISLESELDKGSTFRVTLPRRLPATSGKAPHA